MSECIVCRILHMSSELTFVTKYERRGGGNDELRDLTAMIDLQPAISSRTGYSSGPITDPTFIIDFGERVRGTDAQQLYTLTGAERTDVVYDSAQGRIYITAYIQPAQQNTAATIQ